MNTVRRIAKNMLVLFIAQIVSMGLGFFYTMYTARYLGPEGFGVLSFALGFYRNRGV
jgi:O-antigen/teichoic acid export membrane protein